jgi:hypothetical protein
MTKRKPAKVAKSAAPAVNDRDDREGALKDIGGSQSDDWNSLLANQALQALYVRKSDAETRDRQVDATLAALAGIAPRDELEGMMAAQLIAAHAAVMECYRLAILSDQTPEGRREYLNQANKLSRTWAILLDALNRHRGKGQQKVTVEDVHVHSGGRAVVGLVETAGGRRPGVGGRARLEEYPDAKRIAHAPEPSLWSPDSARDAVPIARDGKRPMPNARRRLARRTQG